MLKTIKKLVTTILLTTITFQISTIISHAAFTKTIPSPIQEIITYDEHGGYYVETLENTPIQNTLSLTSTARVNTLKSKTKTVRYYNDNNVLCWSYALKASFKVKKGTNAIYDSSSASAKIYKTSWNTVSEKHFGSKNTATGSITMKTTKKTVTKKITIKCDKDGNFS